MVFAVLVVAVVAFVLTRDEPDPVEATVATTVPATAPTGTTEALPDSTRPTTPPSDTEEAAATTTVAATPPTADRPALSESAGAFVDGLGELDRLLDQLVSEMSAANDAWDNRDATGARFEDTEAAISAVIDRARALAEIAKSLPVPADLVDRYEGAGGLVERAAGLPSLAEVVLEGLRLPSPDDGTTRRDAVADFVAAARGFAGDLDDLISDIEENAGNLEPTSPASETTTTTTTQPPRELSEEALSYTNGLLVLKQVLVDLAAQADGANRAWDDADESGVTYRQTSAALNETIEAARSFNEQAGSLPIPDAVGTLGDGPIQHAARLPALAEAMLEGLRIPAPDDGSARRTALADFLAAAEDFANSVDNLVSYIEENAASLGLLE